MVLEKGLPLKWSCEKYLFQILHFCEKNVVSSTAKFYKTMHYRLRWVLGRFFKSKNVQGLEGRLHEQHCFHGLEQGLPCG